MKKALVLLLTVAMAGTLAACGGSGKDTGESQEAAPAVEAEAPAESEADAPAAEAEAPAETDSDASYTIGICQLVQHEALDTATQGFKDALT